MLRKKDASLLTSLQQEVAMGPKSDQEGTSGNSRTETSRKAMLPLFFWLTHRLGFSLRIPELKNTLPGIKEAELNRHVASALHGVSSFLEDLLWARGEESSLNHKDTHHSLRMAGQEVGRNLEDFPSLHPSDLPATVVGLRYMQLNAFPADTLTKKI